MNVLTCKLPPALNGRLTALAKRRGVAKSVIVREAIENVLLAEAAETSRPPRTLLEALHDGVGSVASRRGDLARNKQFEGYGR